MPGMLKGRRLVGPDPGTGPGRKGASKVFLVLPMPFVPSPLVAMAMTDGTNAEG